MISLQILNGQCQSMEPPTQGWDRICFFDPSPATPPNSSTRKYPSPLPSLPQLSNPIRTRATSRSSSPRIPAEIGGFIYSDPRTLQNFSAARKWGIAGLVVFRRRHTPLLFWTLCETFSVSAEVATLAISLFPLGCKIRGGT